VRFNASIGTDWRLYRHDIRGSRAHARMLAKAGIIPDADAQQIDRGLAEVEQEIDRGEMPFDPVLEDIHTHVERSLQRRIGRAAGRLHTGRSRNDQVATDERLYLLHEAAPRLDGAIRGLMRALVRRARAHEGALAPGYTHLQRAQPVLLAHHLLAYVEMFSRDLGRVADARARADECPLGSGALAGSPLPLDRAMVAEELGFSRPSRNSMDATSSRDALAEFVAACAVAMTQLSRLAEELVLWSTSEFHFVELDDAYCTGSSLMPHKRNPDAAELVRGKTARVLGDLTSLLAVVKGLPLAYNKDLQEDKAPLFDAVDTTCDSFDVMAGVVETMQIRTDLLLRAVTDGMLVTTDLADYLVERGVPFREAHGTIGALVRRCREAGRRLNDLTDEELAQAHPLLDEGARAALDPKASVARRDLEGGPAPRRVAAELARWERELGLAGQAK